MRGPTALSRTMAVAQASTNGSGAQGRKALGTSAAACPASCNCQGLAAGLQQAAQWPPRRAVAVRLGVRAALRRLAPRYSNGVENAGHLQPASRPHAQSCNKQEKMLARTRHSRPLCTSKQLRPVQGWPNTATTLVVKTATQQALPAACQAALPTTAQQALPAAQHPALPAAQKQAQRRG